MTKYRVGDEVTVRGVIKEIEYNPGFSLLVAIGSAEVWLAKFGIATHTPKPREFKPGDMVTWGNGDATLEIVAIRDGYAIMWSKEYERSVCQPLPKIRHIHEAE